MELPADENRGRAMSNQKKLIDKSKTFPALSERCPRYVTQKMEFKVGGYLEKRKGVN